ncbi:MAG: YihY/virulence factor BrkB family protein [Candidatus Gastranaerophilales bacterium]|nr:YihY/virulence factor BrkB family protein [Candidatus Gastranaerophilales bacterium]
MKVKKRIFFKNIFKNIFIDDFFGMSSEMAFNFLLAIFPFIICLIAVFGLVTDENIIDQIIKILTPFMPSNITLLIKNVLSEITKINSGGLLTFGFLAAAWMATNGMATMIKGLNRAYNVVETRSFWKTRWLAFIMLIIMGFVIFVSVNLIILGTTILKVIDSHIHIPYYVEFTVLLVRWPISFFTLFTMAYLVYYFVPNVKVNKKIHSISVIPGTLFFCVFWLLVSWLFGLYVENFGRFNQVYGTLGAVVVLMVWLYQTSLMILIGGEINSQVYKIITKKTQKNVVAI